MSCQHLPADTRGVHALPAKGPEGYEPEMMWGTPSKAPARYDNVRFASHLWAGCRDCDCHRHSGRRRVREGERGLRGPDKLSKPTSAVLRCYSNHPTSSVPSYTVHRAKQAGADSSDPPHAGQQKIVCYNPIVVCLAPLLFSLRSTQALTNKEGFECLDCNAYTAGGGKKKLVKRKGDGGEEENKERRKGPWGSNLLLIATSERAS